MLEAIGESLFHVGPPGAGMAAKLVNNVIAISGYTAQLEAMQLAAAYGLDEDAVTSFVAVSWGDCRHIRTWGRMDRRRRERAAADAGAYVRMSRDLLNAVDAAKARGVEMPMVAAAAEILPNTLRERDQELDRRGPMTPPPRCTVCNIELAAPFRAAGTHPDCREGCR
jgi:3-hydroxyisobutyrate dehydrogenase